ncbi:MAG: DUF393 domain-containing protein [Nitrosomonas sp. PRO4]|nr:DUF393 domain-containing protein [Nitrosomonas sp. PRO4]
MNIQSKLKVYYNSACPVCKAGIESQMQKMSVCEMQWNDVHKDNRSAAEISTDLEFVRERLHVIDENGDLQIGFDAFLAIWRNYPKEIWKYKVFGLPVLKQFCRFGYNVFAIALYRWNKWKSHW